LVGIRVVSPVHFGGVGFVGHLSVGVSPPTATIRAFTGRIAGRIG
jgi:hypothetical protein